MTMMLVLGRCLLLVVVTIDVSDACDDCSAAADVRMSVRVTSLSFLMFPLLLLLHLLQDVMMMS